MGNFTREEAIELLTRVVSIQIKLHEGKMHSYARSEDIISHRMYIDHLQKELYNIRQLLDKSPNTVQLNSELTIQKIIQHEE